MRSFYRIASSILTFLFLILWTVQLNAQSGGQSSDPSGNVFVIAILIIIGSLVLVSALLILSENFIHTEAKRTGMDATQRQSLASSGSNLWQAKNPKYTNGAMVTDLKKGHDILLKGTPDLKSKSSSAKTFSVNPKDFRGVSPIPKVVVEVGDKIKAGDELFYDKKNPTVKYVSPVSGKVSEVKRGSKRSIEDVIIMADEDIKYTQFEPPSIKEGSRQEIVDYLCGTGGWLLINERPYDVTPAIDSEPKNIFISTFDSAPLAPDLNFVVAGREESFQKGVDTLERLTSGNVHLGLDARSDVEPSEAFTDAVNCQKHWFRGKHPIGNVGIQIHHIAPINVGDKVWTLDVQQVITLGELMYKGIYNAERFVAIAGSEVNEPCYQKTYIGANIGELIANHIAEGNHRIIDGDVLSGKKVGLDAFMGNRGDQVTVVPEGDYHEMFGWLLPLKPRPTISKTFPNFLFPRLQFDGDTNMHGEKRAFVVTGQYEKVLPMNIFPQHLMKAIMVEDFEQIEGLGIYELTEEDIALCEFTCTSKIPLQSILRDGLELMKEQG